MKQVMTRHSGFLAMDPRLKLLTALALLLLVITSSGYAFPLMVLTLSVGVCIAGGMGLKLVALRLAQPVLLVLLVVFLKAFFVGKSPLFSFSVGGMALGAYREGFVEGILIGSRILGAASVAVLLVFTTSFTDIMAALSWLRVPRTLIEITLHTWRYLFLLFDDAMVILNAQKNRLGYVGYRNGIRSFGTLAGTLVIKAFDNSQSITTAMVQRGYDGKMPALAHRPLLRTEIACSTLFVALMLVVWHAV